MSSSSSSSHLAAILPKSRADLLLQDRPTPSPGPHEILIEVRSIALNPIDHLQRAYGFPAVRYPAVLGSDIAGIVLAVGSPSPSDAPKPGTRVAAFAPCFFKKGEPDYGAFQKRVLVPASTVVPLPEGMSFNEGSLLPMAALTVWAGWHTIGLPLDTMHGPADKKGMLVWGAASSIGSTATQIAKLMGFRVYATASQKHHEYIKSLGASQVFDYKDKDVVANIVKAAKEDGVTVDTAFLAAGGDVLPCVKVLNELKGEARLGKVAMAPFTFGSLWWRMANWRNTMVKFIVTPSEEKERNEFFAFVFNDWLKGKLESGEFVASPKIKLVEGGLASIQKALEEFKTGLSGEKMVLEL